MTHLIEPDYVLLRLDVADRDGVFAALAGALEAGGRVRPSYRQALIDREAVFPTGLPVGCGVAIPHTDAEHVITDTIAVATLARPVEFSEMGGGDEPVAVRVVFMLALGPTGEHVKVLKRVVKAIQRDAFLDAVAASDSVQEVTRLARAEFEPPAEG